mmetsp:Transcript_37140/g.36726  ORF Transcript_37140/g.36726 Transcript_37140/m.36726 type:complete len:122 (-) Transcript_37140:25-390(-)
MTDLVLKQKPYMNKLLKNPKKRLKRMYQVKVMREFATPKDLPHLEHGMKMSQDPKNRANIKPEVLKKLDSFFAKSSSPTHSESDSSDDISCLSNRLQRLSILEFIREVRDLKEDYIKDFQR